MLFSILTLFPDVIKQSLNFSILKRAQEKGLVKINLINIRDFATDHYKTVDDKPYGGGVGMILRVDVVDRALNEIKNLKLKIENSRTRIIVLDPKGTTYTQENAKRFSSYEHLVLVCGHYEGVDTRVEKLVDEKISIGDYILTGGEVPALVVVDSVTRLLPGVIRADATESESFNQGLLEPPQYTRPEVYKGMKVPKILLSGDHKKIMAWRTKHSKKLR